MADKVSKYTFEEVEKRLDTIKYDQGSTKVLLGDGTYGDYPDVTQYVTVTQLESSVEEAVRDTVGEASDSDIDSLFQ